MIEHDRLHDINTRYCTILYAQQLDRTGQRECGCLLADGSPRLRGREKEFKFGNEGIQYRRRTQERVIKISVLLQPS